MSKLSPKFQERLEKWKADLSSKAAPKVVKPENRVYVPRKDNFCDDLNEFEQYRKENGK